MTNSKVTGRVGASRTRTTHSIFCELDSRDVSHRPKHPQRKRRRRIRHTTNLQAFGRALKLLHDGTKPVCEVLAELFGDCEVGRFWLEDALSMIQCARIEDEDLADTVQRSTHHSVARSLAAFLVRLCAKCERAGEHIRVKGKAAFWGRQHRKVPLSDFEVAILEEDRLQALEAVGAPIERAPKVERFRREYVPAEQQGGLAAEVERSARTVGRWARIVRRAGFFGSKQPKAWAPDAVVPRGGDYAYAQWTMLRPPPTRLIRTLQALWGEYVATPARPVAAPRTLPSSRAEVRDLQRKTGPPPTAELVALLSDFMAPAQA